MFLAHWALSLKNKYYVISITPFPRSTMCSRQVTLFSLWLIFLRLGESWCQRLINVVPLDCTQLTRPMYELEPEAQKYVSAHLPIKCSISHDKTEWDFPVIENLNDLVTPFVMDHTIIIINNFRGVNFPELHYPVLLRRPSLSLLIEKLLHFNQKWKSTYELTWSWHLYRHPTNYTWHGTDFYCPLSKFLVGRVVRMEYDESTRFLSLHESIHVWNTLENLESSRSNWGVSRTTIFYSIQIILQLVVYLSGDILAEHVEQPICDPFVHDSLEYIYNF